MSPELDQWVSQASSALGLSDDVDVEAILNVAKDVAHNVIRPAAPVSTYLMGLAVARGMDPSDAAQLISELATANRE